MPHPPDGVSDALFDDLDPEAVLDRDSRVLLDPVFLEALHRELLSAGDAALARGELLRMGFLHGMQDALRAQAASRDGEPWVPPLAIRCRSFPADGAFEVRGSWPERREADARTDAGGVGCCAFSAGYTSGWLSGMLDADWIAVEDECGGATRERCRFVAREASRWRDGESGRTAADSIPFLAFRGLVRARHARTGMADLFADDPGSIDRDAACVHIWGPVMVIPFGGTEEGLRALDLIGRDPAAADVSVVIVHLGFAILDEAFGALALEQIIQQAESWGAETLIAEPSPLSTDVLAGLDHPPLLVVKDLEQAVVTAFQIAWSQRRIC
jgi:hypothetical protein